jgi:outer membrane protein assembly factor BamB
MVITTQTHRHQLARGGAASALEAAHRRRVCFVCHCRRRAFTIEQRRDQEAVTAYDVESGHELWATAYPAAFDEPLGGEGPRATPYFDEGKVYSLGAMGDFLCLDAGAEK